MPTSPYADWKKDGLSKLIALASLLCGLIQKWGGVIKSKYADNAAIVALVLAAEALCAALPPAKEAFDSFSFDDSAIPGDTSTLPGINPGADPAEDPEATE
jgi:hypothetical protein